MEKYKELTVVLKIPIDGPCNECEHLESRFSYWICNAFLQAREYPAERIKRCKEFVKGGKNE